MRLHIRHLTTYRYDDPVAYSIQQLRLTPRQDLNQQTLRWHLRPQNILAPKSTRLETRSIPWS